MKLLNDLSPSARSAAMRGGTDGWGQIGLASRNIRYAELQAPRRRKLCYCGCGTRATHRGMANGVCLMIGCELHVRRWVRDGIATSLKV